MAAQGCTYSDLERATDIDRQTIWRYSKGRMSPSVERAYRLARALGTTLDGIYVHDADATDAPQGRKQSETHPAPTDAAERHPVGT